MIRNYLGWLNEKSIYDEKIIEFDNILNNINDFKKTSIYLNNDILELKDGISNMKKIKLKKFKYDNNKIYTELLFDRNVKIITDDILNVLEASINMPVYPKYFNIVYPDGEEKTFDLDIEIETNNLNRIHIPIGLPYILKGLGLGKKIYKKLIYDLGYLSTTSNDRSVDSLFVWESLRKDEEIYTFVLNEKIICISPELEFEKIVDILFEFYDGTNDNDIVILDDDFRIKYPNQINRSKINYLTRIYYLNNKIKNN